MKTILKRFRQDESGATAVEYGLILAMICIAALVAFSNAGTAAANMWNGSSNTIINATEQAKS